MQDQLSGNSTSNLQQQQSNLQQNSPNLQQGGTPTTTTDSSNILSEAAPSGDLRVTTSTTAIPSTIQSDTVASQSGSGAWLLLLIIPALLVALVLWPKKVEAPAEEVIEQSPMATPKPKKTKKKSQKRKKSGRR